MDNFYKILRKTLKRLDFISLSYSQEGEDLLLASLYEDKSVGFYIDAGAHHPKRFSNTYLFYMRGWSGINIDPLIGMSKAFQKQRSRDINLDVGVSRTNGYLQYYMFNEPALNTFSEQRMRFILSNYPQYKLIEQKKIKMLPLSEIFSSYLPPDKKIDFLNIDTEGPRFRSS